MWFYSRVFYHQCVWLYTYITMTSYNDHDGVSNHQPHGCLLNRLFRRRSKKTSKLRVTGLCGGIHRDRWIPRTKGQLHGKCFHVMASSWFPLIKWYIAGNSWRDRKRSQDFGARSRYLRQGYVITSHSKPWDAITYPYLRYLLLTQKSPYMTTLGRSLIGMTDLWIELWF